MSQQSTLLFLFLSLGLPSFLFSQEIKIFTVSDFDLKGNVQSSLVITNYGKEEYYFDETGRLTQSVTRFSDSDYETTHYKYENGELTEKRVENYRDNAFDKATSLANIYKIDTTGNRKVTEKIVSYNKQLLEQNIYSYDADGKLIKIVRTDTEGTDQTSIVYDTVDGKKTVVRKLNNRPVKSVQRWDKKGANGSVQHVMLTETYFDGALNSKTEEVYNTGNQLISNDEALYDVTTEKWIPQEQTSYIYGENDMLIQTETHRGNTVSTKKYIYQFDGSENNNWVKKIMTPDNTYITRRIKYYKSSVIDKEK